MDLVGADADRQFLIADGACARESMSIEIPAPAQQPVGYSTKAKAVTTGGMMSPPITTNYTAESRPQANIANITQSVQEQGQIGAALGARRRVYMGCMAAHGWRAE